MSDFSYIALTKDGRREAAVIQAISPEAAGHMLKEQGLLPVQISEKQKGSAFSLLKSLTTISLGEKIVFISNLGIMIKAGISVPKSLRILTNQTTNSRFKNILTDIASQVEEGKNLGEALEKHANVFSNIFVSMVKVGELGGNLEKSLEYLSTQLQREADLKSKTKGAMMYPAVIVAAMVIIGVLMSIFVLPKLTSIFKDFDTELPLLTRIVIDVADFMGNNGLLVLGMLVALVVAVAFFLRTYPGKKSLHTALLYFPIVNPIVKKINLARFSRILSSLLKSGIPIVQALEVASDSISNVLYRELTAKAAGEVKLGKSLTDTLGKDTNLFPVLVVQMMQVGEESGTTEDILEQLAQHYEQEVDDTMKNLSSIIEPLLLLTIGTVVGFLALALISPIYNISQNIK
jgi:type IV pilus assembly protein PilC